MKQFLTIFRFELLNYLKNKVYIAVTVIIVLVCAAVMTVPTVMKLTENDNIPEDNVQEETEEGESTSDDASDRNESELDRVLIVDGENTGIYEYLTTYLPLYAYEKGSVTSAEASKAVSAGEYTYCLEMTGELTYNFYTQSQGLYDSSSEMFNSAVLSNYKYLKAAEFGLSDEQADVIINAFAYGNVIETGKSFIQSFFYTYILIFLLYMAVLLYGQLVATSVATEKSSRAMELLITSANPKSLMFGKVFGSGTAGLIQMTAILFGAFLSYKINEPALGEIEIISGIFNMPLDILLYTILFFLLGFFIYAFMYAAFSSLASKMEDVQTLIMPVMFLFIGAFFISFYAMMGDVESVFVKVMSFIPFTSPLVMFVRICLSTPASWEIALSVAILAGSTVFIGLFAARLYRIGVLLYGKPPKLNEIFKMLIKG